MTVIKLFKMGGAANQTTLNNGVLQVYGAANDTTIKGGRLIVEKDGGAVFVAIEKGGLLEVKEGGFAFAVDQKAGGAIKTTTRAMEVFGTNRLGQFDIKNGIANNMLLENGGSLRVEENDFAYNTTVDSGGLLEVMDGGTVTGVDKKAGGKLIVSTNALEVSGPNSKGQFSIKDGVSKNYELDDGSGLIVMEDTQAIDTILDKHATMQSLGVPALGIHGERPLLQPRADAHESGRHPPPLLPRRPQQGRTDQVFILLPGNLVGRGAVQGNQVQGSSNILFRLAVEAENVRTPHL